MNRMVSILTVRRMYLFLALLFLLSCKKEDFDFSRLSTPEIEMEGAVPLVHSNLQLKRLLPGGSLIEEDPQSGLLTLIYETEILSLKAGDYIQIPEQEGSFSRNDLEIIVAPGIDFTIPFYDTLDFTPPVTGQRLDSIQLKKAVIDLEYISGINHNCAVTFRFPTATKNGQAFECQFDNTYTGSLPVTGTIHLDFTGYTLKLITGPGGIQQLPLNFEVKVFGDNNPNLSPYTFTLNAKISQIRFNGIFGYLGQYEYPLNDSVVLGIFSNNLSGSIQFEDLKLKLTTDNSIGMPMELDIQEITALSTKNAPYSVDITDNPLFPNPVSFLSPGIHQVGQSVQSTTLFTTGNCNLNQALNIAPQKIIFRLNGRSNPAGNPADENFVMDTSRFRVTARVELPFYGSITDFALTDTLNFDFEDIEELEAFSFIIVSRNRFPLNIDLQVLFADENGSLLDSLIYDSQFTLLQAAPVGGPPNYRVIDDPPVPAFTYQPPVLTRQRLESLGKTKKMIIRALLNTSNSGLIKIYSDYNLDVRLGAKATYKTQ